jgi:hypothetical protein
LRRPQVYVAQPDSASGSDGTRTDANIDDLRRYFTEVGVEATDNLA